jgi:antitoxin (DNA-binding transcriptional repressor) of toxin-antitoxin stability system
MMTRITLEEAQEQLVTLIERIEAGEEIIIEKDDKPVARLSPVNGQKRSRPVGTAKDLIQIADDFDAPIEDFAKYQ